MNTKQVGTESVEKCIFFDVQHIVNVLYFVFVTFAGMKFIFSVCHHIRQQHDSRSPNHHHLMHKRLSLNRRQPPAAEAEVTGAAAEDRKNSSSGYGWEEHRNGMIVRHQHHHLYIINENLN